MLRMDNEWSGRHCREGVGGGMVCLGIFEG